MTAQNTPNATDCCSHSFWTQTPRKPEKYEWGLKASSLEATMGLRGPVKTQHTQAQSVFHLGQRARSSPKTTLIKGKCQTKVYESLCCVVWQPRAQKYHQLSISRYTGKERKFSQRAALLLWLSYFLNESSFWLISLKESGNSHAHPPKKIGELRQLCICTKWERRGRAKAPTWWSGRQLENSFPKAHIQVQTIF